MVVAEYTMQRLGIPTPEELAAFNPIVPEGTLTLFPTSIQLFWYNLWTDSEDDDEDGSEDEDEDIAMPAGPRPGGGAGSDDSDSDSDDDDDIPMPSGPPPPKPSGMLTYLLRLNSALRKSDHSRFDLASNPSFRVHIPRPSRPSQSHPNPHSRPSHPQQNPHNLPPRPAFLPPAPSLPPPPNAPTGPRNPHQLPSRPPPSSQHMSDPMTLGDSQPQRAFQQGIPQPSIGPQFPPASSSSATISAAPSPFLSIGNPSASASSASTSSSATISAAPQLRDLKKEATAFLPAAMRKKQQQQKAKLERVGLSKVDASRGDSSRGDGEEGVTAIEKGPSLMESLKARGVGAGGLSGSLPPPKKREDEDYKKFEENMKEFL